MNVSWYHKRLTYSLSLGFCFYGICSVVTYTNSPHHFIIEFEQSGNSACCSVYHRIIPQDAIATKRPKDHKPNIFIPYDYSVSTWLRNRTFIINGSTAPSVARKTFLIISPNTIAIIRECFYECNESDNPDVLKGGEETLDANETTLRYYIIL